MNHRSVPLDAGTVRAFSEATGDVDPIHIEPGVARAQGFANISAPGVLYLPLVEQVALDHGHAFRSLTIDLNHVALAGDVLQLAWEAGDGLVSFTIDGRSARLAEGAFGTKGVVRDHAVEEGQALTSTTATLDAARLEAFRAAIVGVTPSLSAYHGVPASIAGWYLFEPFRQFFAAASAGSSLIGPEDGPFMPVNYELDLPSASPELNVEILVSSCVEGSDVTRSGRRRLVLRSRARQRERNVGTCRVTLLSLRR